MYYPVKELRILSGSRRNAFGMVRKYENGTPKPHQGWDLEARNGTPFYAVADGTVVKYDKTDNTAYGKSLTIKLNYGGENLYAYYAHISSSLVEKDQPVLAGEQIGFTGSTGNAKGSKSWEQHLHFEFRYRQDCGKGLEGRIDPVRFYGPPPLAWIFTDQPIYLDWLYGGAPAF